VQLVEGKLVRNEVPALSAINMRLRDDYTRDAAGGVKRWNAIIEKTGVSFELKLPHEGFHRQIGVFVGAAITPDGAVVSPEEWARRKAEWLPTRADGDFIQSLMKPVWAPGQYAGWIAPPKVGIDNKPGDFEYVQLHMA
jgi:benzoyl-CoA 2,3-dioxygenase component B